MSKPAISVEGLSKQYRIGAPGPQYRTLSDSLSSALAGTLKALRGGGNAAASSFWALQDVSFSVAPGEVVGIIGRNGAGKSTLLKILSRITEPTRGRVSVRGRMASLLEVGTGFHAELSGRENVYLNGAILGMSRREIQRKFDEIVSFSEVEQFIDTPVKRYSSGMYLRLAFAVAAHLEPEILVVDEVLAVGDASFQQKCIGKMDAVAREGRTVLFVSHNMTAVQALCTRGIVLRAGTPVFDGTVSTAVQEYLRYITATASRAFEDNPERSGSGAVKFTNARLIDALGQTVNSAIAGEPLAIELEYHNHDAVERADILLTIFNQCGIAVSHLSTEFTASDVPRLAEHGLFRCQIPSLPLPLGDYRIAASIRVTGAPADLMPSILTFSIAGSTFFPTGRLPDVHRGACLLSHQWHHRSTVLMNTDTA